MKWLFNIGLLTLFFVATESATSAPGEQAPESQVRKFDSGGSGIVGGPGDICNNCLHHCTQITDIPGIEEAVASCNRQFQDGMEICKKLTGDCQKDCSRVVRQRHKNCIPRFCREVHCKSVCS